MSYIVYGGAVSPFVRKVRIALAEKNLAYTLDQVNPFNPPPEFLAISPLKRIPVLRDTERAEPNTLPDSSIIIDYLEHKHPAPALYPADPFERGRALWYEEYADSVLAQNIGRGLFFERFVKRMMRGQPDEAVCSKTLTEVLPPLFAHLETEIGGKEFLAGDAFSIADLSVGSMLVNFAHCGESVDAAHYPKLAAYTARIHARPSFKTLIDEETPMVKHIMKAA
ncbi:MAG TPA: glutathione S-transferase family protein [Rhizomicrobium sp.]|jgi:glutathione S-transferase|nr:glutathione S-transferase family protein [Rhizomicrobium sp.]